MKHEPNPISINPNYLQNISEVSYPCQDTYIDFILELLKNQKILILCSRFMKIKSELQARYKKAIGYSN